MRTGNGSPVSEDSSTSRCAALDDPAVGRDDVGAAEQHHVTGDELVPGQGDFLPVAADPGGDRGLGQQRRQRPVGATALNPPISALATVTPATRAASTTDPTAADSVWLHYDVDVVGQ